MRYFSMFTGVGGFELGLENANKKIGSGRANNNRKLLSGQKTENLSETKSNIEGGPERFTCIGMSEINKYSCQVLRYKFPGIKNYGDATKINPNKLPDFDMLCGGFPCQAFSIAGQRRGFQDTRGTLFFEIARILKVKRPKIVFLENVKGLLNLNKGENFKVILQSLGELGYGVQWMVLNSKFFGVAQNRERVFIIGNSRGTPRPKILPFGENDQKIDDLQGQSANTLTARYEPAQGNGNYFIESGKYEEKIPVNAKTLMGGGHSGGLHSDMTVIPDNMKIRRLTPIECCRLQGFPDDFIDWGIDENGNKVKISDSQKYKMTGNAITTNVVSAIGEKILKLYSI